MIIKQTSNKYSNDNCKLICLQIPNIILKINNLQ